MGRDTLRKCNTCGLEAHTQEDLELFTKNKTCLYGRTRECNVCHNKRKNRYRKNNPKPYRDSNIKSMCKTRYKITFKEYKERMATSDCCEICNTKDDLCYDHCHDTMKFRGILCNKCNRGIGMLGDTLESIMKVVRYLTKKENV